ncbi:nicotinate-nucleotide adenylyltransferase [Ectobacillus ponti]|uniref:Probable nicotinate-nucleotide adenylyltransferase n=1 Tax=Ectobacillus ponti TaxID=2961894 RepID=A0AA42BMT3_9BACI|nr:nicotinate-nucleotide adenylyltransferase [Ectobacillus ponti]MCP8967195.1 nicotinate-nucleotide adenylyltransferase [Ectobacillus ponti]
MKKVGIVGGTFDPPHYGHLLIANEAYHALGLDEVWFLPNQIPPHKLGKDVAGAADRVEMLRLAAAGKPAFSLCLIELEREGPSYTYDTICRLRQQYPDISFFFIIGGDMVEYLPKWHRVEELVSMVQFVGVTRPGYTLHTPYPIQKLEIPEFAVSSSLIRERFQSGGTTDYLLPEKVREYIQRSGLYGASTSTGARPSADA